MINFIQKTSEKVVLPRKEFPLLQLSVFAL